MLIQRSNLAETNRHYSLRPWRVPRGTGENSPRSHQAAEQQTFSQDHFFPVLAACGGMETATGRIQVLQRTMVGGEGLLICMDQPHRCPAREKPESSDHIAHRHECRYDCSQHTMQEVLTTADILDYLQITVAVLLIVVLYHSLFIAVDLRKVLRRIEIITKEVENLIMKPINVADHILEGIVKYLENQQILEKKGKRKKE